MSRKRWITLGWIAAGLVLAFGLLALLGGPVAYARLATGYVAQQTCACLHVANRELASCLSDYPAEAVSHINVTQDGATVRASAFGVFKAEAAFEDGFGCSLRD